MSDSVRIGCPVCFGELALVSPWQEDREMICRCKSCSRMIIIEEATIVTQLEQTKSPRAATAQMPTTVMSMHTYLPHAARLGYVPGVGEWLNPPGNHLLDHRWTA
jgi:hypothetical protein